jgi:hypothetical protein
MSKDIKPQISNNKLDSRIIQNQDKSEASHGLDIKVSAIEWAKLYLLTSEEAEKYADDSLSFMDFLRFWNQTKAKCKYFKKLAMPIHRLQNILHVQKNYEDKLPECKRC